MKFLLKGYTMWGKPNEFNTRPRNIVAKFSFFKDRELVRRRVCPLLSPPPPCIPVFQIHCPAVVEKKIHYVVAIGSIFTCGTVIIRQAISWRTSKKSQEFNYFFPHKAPPPSLRSGCYRTNYHSLPNSVVDLV